VPALARACIAAILLLAPALAGAAKTKSRLPRALSRSVGHPPSRTPARQAPDSTVAPQAAAEDPAAPRLQALQDALRDLLHSRPLGAARVGVEVVSAQTGHLLFAHNADRMFDPASNEKILTTATALARLGPEYRYRTELFGPSPDDDGVVAGDVFLRGNGDPSLSTRDLVDLASVLVRSGVRRIKGGIVVDERTFDRRSGAPVDTNSSTRDELGYAAITLNRNTFTVRVQPTSSGQHPEVAIDPPADYLVVENHATTVASGRSRIKVDARPGKESTVITISGRVPDGHDGIVVHRRPFHPALFAASSLTSIVRDLGIEVEGAAHAGATPAGEALLGVHESPPLSLIIRKSNKDSNNFVAERVFQTVGAELFGAPATATKGQQAVREYLKEVGLQPGTFNPTNGSGLAHSNRVTPDALVRLLRRLYHDLSVAPDFLQSLAVGGIDGTIRNRFARSDAVGLVRAKTGTLNGVSALSGYVGHKEDVLIFSILVQGFRQRRLQEVRRAQVQMVTAMLRFLRGTESPAAPVEPAVDIESADETVDAPQDPEPAPAPKSAPAPK
jgi:D-alanyl-D-alanine carboxypeptidase/D-alanyl-D-alanine-endopeptidase (penicillin-binding protein 4)